MKDTRMKRIFPIFILLIAGVAASAQTMEQEVARVREQLGVSDSTPISLGDSKLSSANPLKVYIAVGLDMEVRKRTVKRIDDWNKHDAAKYGALTIVSDLSQADVILCHYDDRDLAVNAYIPGHSYILAPKGNGYEVLWRYQGTSFQPRHRLPLPSPTGAAGQKMDDHFFDMLKHRK
jgi:hypothetical protein